MEIDLQCGYCGPLYDSFGYKGPRGKGDAVTNSAMTGLFRFVPWAFRWLASQPATILYERESLGGCSWLCPHTQVFDIMDIVVPWIEVTGLLLEEIMSAVEGLCTGFLVSLMAVLGIALLSTAAAGMGMRPRARAHFGGVPGRLCAALVTAYLFHAPIPLVRATKYRKRCELPLPSDLDIWMAGQRTLAEQLADAEWRRVLDTPLQHNRGTAAPPDTHARPVDLIEETGQPEMEELTLHATIWLAVPYYESEVLNLELPRPLSLSFMKEAILGACTTTPGYFGDLHPTVPQLGEYFGSFVAQPEWTRDKGKRVLVLDARAVGGTAFAFYVDGRLNHATLRHNLQEYHEEQLEFYAFGSRTPLEPGRSISTIDGGVVKAVLPGQPCIWSDNLDVRMEQPARWRPTFDPPRQEEGLHNVIQSAHDQVVDEIEPLDLRPMEEVAGEVLGMAPNEITVFLPVERLPGLSHGGRSIWEQVAVLSNTAMPDTAAFVIFLDLRPLACFPQWVQTSEIFDPKAYIEDLQIADFDDWVLTVEGGEEARRGKLRIRHREVLIFSLQPPGSSSDSSDTDEDDSGDMLRSPNSDILHSSDLDSPPPPGPGEGPRGPPPPRPIDRSRSPRREGDLHDSRLEPPDCADTPRQVRLADYVGPPTFDVTRSHVHLPHDLKEIAVFMQTWQEWTPELELGKISFKQPTIEAISQMVHWSSLSSSLGHGASSPELHVYTDGSWKTKQKVGGYAVVLLLVTAGASAIYEILGEQTQGNPASCWTYEAPPALKNEQIAIAAALLWLLQGHTWALFSRVLLHFDCHAAGLPADGSWAPVNGFAKQLRAIEGLLQRLMFVPLKFVHTKAHIGHPFNEMADVLANQVGSAALELNKPPEAACRILQHGDLSWVAVAFDYGSLPLLDGRTLCWSEDDRLGISHLRPDQLVPTRDRGTLKPRAAIEFKAMSLNAQSLGGKCRYYEEQLDDLGFNLAFFQETMGHSAVCSSRRFLRLSTESDRHWGTAIWISRTRGIASCDGKPQLIQEEDIKVLHESPRLLALMVNTAFGKVVVISGHCPHSAKRAEAKKFHDEIAGHLSKGREAGIVIVGIDLNGRIPTGLQGTTGDLVHGEPGDNGVQFSIAAVEAGVWFPATYREYHTGTTTTYRQANGAEHRIDYVGLGGKLSVDRVVSWVEHAFDTANANDDHAPVAIDITGTRDGASEQKRIFRPRYDTGKMLTKEGRAIIAQELSHYAPPPWDWHPDDHYQHLQTYLHEIMAKHFGLDPGSPHASYIPPDVWRLRDGKLRLKQRTRHRKDLWAALLSRALQQLRYQEDYGVAALLSKQAVIYDVVAGAIRWATARIKHGIRQAKATFLQSLAYQAGDRGCDVLHKAKSAGVGGKQARPISRPLPGLKTASGVQAGTWEERDEIWMRHFGEQEMGVVVQTKEFLQGEDQGIFQDEEIEWTIQDVPSLQELEEILRQVPRRKASGLDGVPGEVLLAAPPMMSRALLPLVVKSVVRLQQPVQWRGGILQESWKRAGSIDDPNSYRSLFISSQVGKCYHKLLRRRVGSALESALHDFHLGARKNAPVLFPALYIHGFLRRARQKKHSVAILFLDMQSAYYRVIRELAVGHVSSDDAVIHVFRFFDIGPDEMQEFAAMIQQGGMMQDAGMPAAARHLAKDLLHRSWFVTRHGSDEQINSTHAGSRPGESWADVVFSFVLSKILLQIMEHATAEELLTDLSLDLEGGIYTTAPDMEKVQAQDCTWADDCAFPMSDSDPNRLVCKTSRLGSIVLDYCQRHGMAPNLKPKKTAFILAIRGRGSQKAKRQWFPRGERHLHLVDLDLRVNVMSQYVHLGGLVDTDMRLSGEARRRLGMAQSAFDAGKSLLFTNMSIPLQVRASLFCSSVVSTFFNLALWTEDTEAWDKMETGFSRLLRGLLSKTYKGDLLYKVAPPAVHILTGVLPLTYIARKARISLLGSMARSAPKGLWAILQEEQTWLQQVQRDLAWLVGDSEDWPGLREQNWPEWHNLLGGSMPWVKRRVKSRLEQEMKRFRSSYMVLICLWALWRRATVQTASDKEHQWICRPCGRRLKTRAALGAHFYKVHGRAAKYRAVVQGTLCPACGREFWSRNRLSVHLRDAPSCVGKLYQVGSFASERAPGIGSRRWRQHAEEDYTLAVPQQQHPPMEAEVNDFWDDYMTQAHRAICDLLTHDSFPESNGMITASLQQCLAKFPLYPTEMEELTNHVVGELQALQQAGVADQWSTETIAAIKHALQSFDGSFWSHADLQDDHRSVTTLRNFQKEVEDVNWRLLCQEPYYLDETPKACLRLTEDWEAAFSSDSGLADVAAVQGSYWLFVPEELRVAWDATRTGVAVQICAPATFWCSPLSRPFAHLRELSAS